jgi:hypothetical protein
MPERAAAPLLPPTTQSLGQSLRDLSYPTAATER